MVPRIVDESVANLFHSFENSLFTDMAELV